MIFDFVDIFDFQVLKESFKIYCAINDGIINLVDKVNWFIIMLDQPIFNWVMPFCLHWHWYFY